jgi:type II secretory ATPase GspE/PulE/Tfp pilus assembly ATPase PilB-like protein
MVFAHSLTLAFDMGYVSIVKLAPILLLTFLWAKLMAWADKDALAAHMPREGMNAVHMGLFLAAFGAFLALPIFWIALGIYLGLFFTDVGIYLSIRNKQVGLADIRKSLAGLLSGLKSKNKSGYKAGEVAILTKEGPAPAPDADDPLRPGYQVFQTLLTDPIRKDAERVEFRPNEGAYAARFWVDGVPYDLANSDPETGASCISYVKSFADMDVDDHRKPQSGKIKVSFGKARHELDIATAGTTAGESLRIGIDTKKRLNHRLDALGLAEDQLARVQAVIQENQGVVLVAAPKQQGLTTLLYCIIRSHDAFVQHIQAVERLPREELEGVTVVRLGTNAGPNEEFKQIEWVVSQQPDVIVLDEVTNPASARELVPFATGPQAKRVYIGMRAGSTFEALEQWRKLVGDDAAAAESLSLIVSSRVLRRLCQACKIAYQPDPETLRKLNMDPAKVQTLFQARTQPMTDQKGRPVPCTFCHDLHFKGRFGVYETFNIDDEVRQLIAGKKPVNELKKIFRKQRNRFLQEIAMAQVEAGETSLQELLRVLKSPESSPSRKA